MKKLILATAVIFGVFYSAHSQTTHFGFKAGVNFASIGGEDVDEFDGRTGFHAGILAEFMITEQFGIQPELLYSMQGAESEYSESGITEKGKIKLDYINIPLLAKYYVTPALNFQLGPQLGFLINSEGEYEVSFQGETMSETIDLDEEVKNIDFGISGGLGYKLNSGIFFNGRYTLGIIDINEENEFDGDGNQNNVFQLSVGYMF
ncbi:porin family protein [Gramella sp. KN1008]|uniref:porin family protein n=1 Tax=Gramella sp. KN1008 TaxID=2529298 RepID=UPI00103E6F2E|nr:porin family protein [Gramella sp. KN1008]TBW25763.1 PorT family protein [Gramella sp. KN1008]